MVRFLKALHVMPGDTIARLDLSTLNLGNHFPSALLTSRKTLDKRAADGDVWEVADVEHLPGSYKGGAGRVIVTLTDGSQVELSARQGVAIVGES